MEKQVAAFILQMISRSTMSADDQTQASITATKQWLAAISRGQLVVVAPDKVVTPAEEKVRVRNKKREDKKQAQPK